MSDVENTCRICRGEGTETQPLLHPCKCRGSIRYIHQECLLEWLKHSNKSTEQCDICNTPYRFRTIYDKDMPTHIPLKYIGLKLFEVISMTSITSISILLYVFCLIIQVPVFWKFVGRIYTYGIDGHLPSANATFVSSLMYGDLDLNQYDLPAAGTFKSVFFKLVKFFDSTYLSGLRYIFVSGFVLLALFIEHEWVIRDEGYTKLLYRKIGKEPRTKLVDILQQALTGLRDEAQVNADANANLQRVQELARAIHDLQQRQGNGQHLEALRRAVREERPEDEDHDHIVEDHDHENDHEIDNADFQNDDGRNDTDSDFELDDERRTIYIGPQNVRANPEPNAFGNQPDPAPLNALNNQNQNNRPIFEEDNHNATDSDSESESESDDNNFNAVEEEAREAAAVNAPGNLFEFLGLSLNIQTPILSMMAADLFITAFLFVVYLIPHMLGNALIGSLGFVIRNLVRPVVNLTLTLDKAQHLITYVVNQDGSLVKSGNDFVDFAVFTITELIVKPLYRIFDDLFLQPFTFIYDAPAPVKSSMLVERIISLTVGYCIISYAAYRFMRRLTAGPKPIMGASRNHYKALFEMASTLKVFLVFAIEIFFFPVYCGWLLDFCAAPLLLPYFTTVDQNSGNASFLLLFTSVVDTLQIPFVRVGWYWASGTLYMLLFALFIGMVRNQILRPGVLFFIRSPDDPNARLIHDALVKPFTLQLSRIYLSAKVYTGFILVGIGGVTWGLRFLVTPAVNESNQSKPENFMLPIQKPNLMAFIFLTVLIHRLMNLKHIITKYCQSYWSHVFEISCHKLRLSHFILDIPISQERGYIVYRNWWHRLLGTSLPDYSRPVTYKEALKIFQQHKDVIACFVPDGNYIRAPDNDTVSRKFIKKLFVPVTKDDKLISVNNSNASEHSANGSQEGYESDSSDDEMNNDNAYTIVYRPPNFKTRSLLLILMLWVFAVLLILLVSFSAWFIGKPVSWLTSFIPQPQVDNWEVEWAIQPSNSKLADFGSILFGFCVQLIALQAYDGYLDRKTPRPQRVPIDDMLAEHFPDMPNPPPADENPANIEGPGNEVQEDGQNFWRLNNASSVIDMMICVWAVFAALLCPLYFHSIFALEPLAYYKSHILKVGPETISYRDIIYHLSMAVWSLSPFFKVTVSLFKLYVSPEPLETFNIIRTLDLVSMHSRFLFLFAAFLTCETLTLQSVESAKYKLRFVGILTYTIINYVIGGYRIGKKLEEQIKIEKYVRGRAIENIDEE